MDLAKLSLWLGYAGQGPPVHSFSITPYAPGDSLVGLTQEADRRFPLGAEKAAGPLPQADRRPDEARHQVRQEILAARDDVFYEYYEAASNWQMNSLRSLVWSQSGGFSILLRG